MVRSGHVPRETQTGVQVSVRLGRAPGETQTGVRCPQESDGRRVCPVGTCWSCGRGSPRFMSDLGAPEESLGTRHALVPTHFASASFPGELVPCLHRSPPTAARDVPKGHRLVPSHRCVAVATGLSARGPLVQLPAPPPPQEREADALSAEITNLLTLKYINQSFTIMARSMYSVPW